MYLSGTLAIALMRSVFYWLSTRRTKEPKDQDTGMEMKTLKAELAGVQDELQTLRLEIVRLHLQDVECQSFRKKLWEQVTEMKHKYESKMTRHSYSWHGSSSAN